VAIVSRLGGNLLTLGEIKRKIEEISAEGMGL
jgi:hypothetical protein